MSSARPSTPRGAVAARDGIVLIDKPAGLTSHDVVARTRRLAATRKVGHAGTLDPMATGLLVLGIGRATRLLTYLVGADKTYEATVRLGQDTLTEDAEGEVTASLGCSAPASWPGGQAAFNRRLDDALRALTGPIMQVPSAVSAIKIDGVRSYKRVRGGEDVALPARSVTIHSLTRAGAPVVARAADGAGAVDVDVVDLPLHVSCSSGTYVRALARDLGARLGTGAHLTALRRTSVGPFEVSRARGLDDLAVEVAEDAARPEPAGLATLSLSAVARRCFPVVELDAAEAVAIRHGQALPAEILERAVRTADVPQAAGTQDAGAADDHHGVTAGFAPNGDVVALLARKGGRARPVLVLSPA